MAGRKLKVFRTAIGFHDAYVAAPSMKAALQAWGSERNLFATGAAEQVTEGRPVAAALAEPGAVIKVARGTADQHIAALPKKAARKKPVAGTEPKPAKARSRRPGRAALDRAEKAVERAEAERDEALGKIDRQIAELNARRRKMREERDREIDRLSAKREAAEQAYDRALAEWKDADDG